MKNLRELAIQYRDDLRHPVTDSGAIDRRLKAISAVLSAPNDDLKAKIMSAIEDIAAERQRQRDVEGWTPEHDDAHGKGQLADAAACYALEDLTASYPAQLEAPEIWPWDVRWWKPKDRRRDLVRAGALIVAEIERLDRAELSPIATEPKQ